ncbi:MAG: ABC transporter ATP-binding protein [Planctomycetia bacterium]|nr:ABC transporter ATP-binding protein [Planctomycetia bacterium]
MSDLQEHPSQSATFPVLGNVTELTCQLDGKIILAKVTFSVKKGDFTAILGPNGAGKSTLLKCLMRILPTESGIATLGGKNLSQFSSCELARYVAYVPQAQMQNFPITVRHFIEASRYAYQSPWDALSPADKTACEYAMTVTDLENLADRELRTLSGGELQRVWIAGALAQETEILLLDEAVSQMDYRARKETLSLLRQLNREQGKTILMITHDLNEAVQNANRILALKEGKLIFDGVTADFLTEKQLETVFDTEFVLISDPRLPFPAVMLK